MMSKWTMMAALAALVACAPSGPPEAPPPEPPPEAAAAVLTPMPYQITLGFSDAAAKKLSGMGEDVTVSANYYGEPKPGFEPVEPGDPGVSLGEEELIVAPTAQTVSMQGLHDAAKAEAQVVSGARVLINVYSARKAHEDNLLDCGILDDTLAAAAAKPTPISCKLIEE